MIYKTPQIKINTNVVYAVTLGFMCIFYTSFQIYSMDDSIKEQLEEARLNAAAIRTAVFAHGANYFEEVAHIARTAGNRMSGQEKLDHLIGDPRWNDRKNVIMDMIEQDHIDPNTIQYQYTDTPIKESIAFNDVDFTAYLLSHGATPPSDQEKLNLIYRWEPRKKLITKMITIDHIDPNTIQYGSYSKANPLYDSYDAKDVAFAQYLLNQGAHPDKMNFAHVFFKDRCVKWLSQNHLIPPLSVTTTKSQPKKEKIASPNSATETPQLLHECPICLESFSNHPGGLAGAECKFKCGHSLCTVCFASWQTTCPLCRAEIR